jgi:transcription elongation factor Elf1
MTPRVVSETLHYILCPYCGKDRSRICHLFGQNISFGPWFCKECGVGYRGRVEGTKVVVERCEARFDKTTVFLRRNDLVLAVEGISVEGGDPRFYYEEHTCPINYFQRVQEIYDLSTGEHDPHGIFSFVGEVPEITDLEKLDIHLMMNFLD